MPTDRTIKLQKKYDQLAAEYQKNLTDDEYYNYITSKFSKRVKGNVLDAGCGNGYITNLLKMKNLEVIGIDLSEGMIREARKLYPNVVFQTMDLRALKFRDAIFDGIFCFQTFQHIPPEHQGVVLQHFRRVLKPGGLLCFNTKNVFCPKNFIAAVACKMLHPVKFGEDIRGGKTGTYRYLTTFNEIKKKVKKAGFEIKEVKQTPFSNWIQVWAKKKAIF